MGKSIKDGVGYLELMKIDKKAWIIQTVIVATLLLAYWVPEIIKYYV